MEEGLAFSTSAVRCCHIQYLYSKKIRAGAEPVSAAPARRPSWRGKLFTSTGPFAPRQRNCRPSVMSSPPTAKLLTFSVDFTYINQLSYRTSKKRGFWRKLRAARLNGCRFSGAGLTEQPKEMPVAPGVDGRSLAGVRIGDAAGLVEGRGFTAYRQLRKSTRDGIRSSSLPFGV